MKKVLFVATVVKTHIMQFHIPYLQFLKKQGWETAVAARNDYEDKAECRIPYCDHYFDIPFERSPLKKENIEAYRRLKELIDLEEYDIIHCHTPVGALVTRLAARNSRNHGTKVFYTAHGFHFYKGAPLKNWLFYYPVEWWLAYYTDVLITINQEDYQIAKKKFHAKQIEYVPGVGIDLKKFGGGINDNSIEFKRRELNIGKSDIFILSVGELISRKNHELIIRQIAKLKNPHLKYFICGRGPLQEKLAAMIQEQELENQVKLLGYRNDISELCKASDLFVFPSLQEGLPVALMEAIASKTLVICSAVRGNIELVRDKSFLFDPRNEKSVQNCIQEVLKMSELKRQKVIDENYETLQKFELENVLILLWALYKKNI